MQGDRKAGRVSRFDQDYMASVLTIFDPAGPLESSQRLLSRNDRQGRHLRRNLDFANLNRQWHCMSGACCQATHDRFTNIIQCLGFRTPLRDAARNSGTLGNYHAAFVRLQGYEKLHN